MSAAIFNGDGVKILKDKLKFKTTGEIHWDSTNGCPAYDSPYANVTNQIGQETHVKVCNMTGSTILNGSVVYVSTSSGGLPCIALAIANDYVKSRILGTVTADILTGETGIVTRDGIINNLNTNAFNAGDILYLSPTVAGTFTATKPVDGNFAVTIGIVTNKDATIGSIIAFHDSTEFTVETLQSVGWSTDYGPATLSWVDGALGATRTLTLTPVGAAFHFYQMGVKYSKATDSFQITDAEGTHLIYYNLGTLTEIVNPTADQVLTIIKNNPIVAAVYWDFTNRTANYIGKELHDMQFPAAVHAYNHFAYGARYGSGLALNTFVVDASGALATHAQFGVDAGDMYDEDLKFAVTTIASTTGLPVYYLLGTTATPTLRKGTNAGYSMLTTGTGRAAYNFLTGGNWTLAEVTNTNFVLYHIFIINENTAANRVIAIMGQSQYTTVALARAAALTEIQTLSVIPAFPKEMKSLGTVIYETNNTYVNAVKSRIRSLSTGPIVNYQDWRAVNTTGGAAGGTAVVTSYADNTFEIFDNIDATKIFKFEASSIATTTTRTITVPNRDLILNVTSGIRLDYSNDGLNAWGEETGAASFYQKAYTAVGALSQYLHTSFRVPNDFIPGRQIKLRVKIFSPTGSGTLLITSVSTLIRNATDALSSTTNQRTSTNTAQAVGIANFEYMIDLDLTDTAGAINGIAVSPNDTILIALTRGTDTNADLLYFISSTSGVFI